MKPQTQVELTSGNYNLYQIRGFTNLALTDQFGLSIAINYKHENGYGDRLDANGNTLGRMGDQRNFATRVKARITPTDRLTIDLSGDYTRYRNTATPGQTVIVPSGLLNLWNARIGNAAGTPVSQAVTRSGDYDNYSRNAQPARDDLGGASATIAYDLGEAGTERNISTIIPGLFTLRAGPEIARDQLLDQTTTNYALFAQATGHIADGLSVTLGTRHQRA